MEVREAEVDWFGRVLSELWRDYCPDDYSRSRHPVDGVLGWVGRCEVAVRDVGDPCSRLPVFQGIALSASASELMDGAARTSSPTGEWVKAERVPPWRRRGRESARAQGEEDKGEASRGKPSAHSGAQITPRNPSETPPARVGQCAGMSLDTLAPAALHRCAVRGAVCEAGGEAFDQRGGGMRRLVDEEVVFDRHRRVLVPGPERD